MSTHGGQFDQLFDDGLRFRIGELVVQARSLRCSGFYGSLKIL